MTYEPRSRRLQTVHQREMSLAVMNVGWRSMTPSARPTAERVRSIATERRGSGRTGSGGGSSSVGCTLPAGGGSFALAMTYLAHRRRVIGMSTGGLGAFGRRLARPEPLGDAVSLL